MASLITPIGRLALAGNTTGERHTALGNATLYRNLSGNGNTVVGSGALLNNVLGHRYSAFEAGAGSVKGPTALSSLEDAENSVFISTDCRSANFLNNNTNSIVIGANAIGEGSNTTVIGTTTTKTKTKTKTITAAAIKLEGKVTLAVPQGDISMGIYQ